MRALFLASVILGLLSSPPAGLADDLDPLRRSLTLHASFDESFEADFSRGTKACVVQQGETTIPAVSNDDVRIVEEGRYGSALHFTRKSTYRPQFAGGGVLDYTAHDWSRTVSVWLKLNPDLDLAPGYCDPVQIVGDDTKQGFIFLEWSKDHSPRHFRYAVRPQISLWNPKNVGWEEIPEAERPMVRVHQPPFAADRWTHVVFTLEHINQSTTPPRARLLIDGQPRGAIENWDLRLGWTPERVRLVLGASYVGRMDDLSVFDRPLTDPEVARLHGLPHGAADLHP
jgi:hypothetical protein